MIVWGTPTHIEVYIKFKQTIKSIKCNKNNIFTITKINENYDND